VRLKFGVKQKAALFKGSKDRKSERNMLEKGLPSIRGATRGKGGKNEKPGHNAGPRKKKGIKASREGNEKKGVRCYNAKTKKSRGGRGRWGKGRGSAPCCWESRTFIKGKKACVRFEEEKKVGEE